METKDLFRRILWRKCEKNQAIQCLLDKRPESIQPRDFSFRFFHSDGLVEPEVQCFWRSPILGSNKKTRCQNKHMDMLTSWNYVIWCTYYVFPLFQPSGSCKLFRFEYYYTSNSNSKNRASWHHYRPVARTFTPWSLTWNLKRIVSIKGMSFSRGLFSGSMLNFKGLSLWTFWSNFAFENDHKKGASGKADLSEIQTFEARCIGGLCER